MLSSIRHLWKEASRGMVRTGATVVLFCRGGICRRAKEQMLWRVFGVQVSVFNSEKKYCEMGITSTKQMF